MQDSREKKRCLIFARNNANDTADRIEAYAKKSGMANKPLDSFCAKLNSTGRIQKM